MQARGAAPAQLQGIENNFSLLQSCESANVREWGEGGGWAVLLKRWIHEIFRTKSWQNLDVEEWGRGKEIKR